MKSVRSNGRFDYKWVIVGVCFLVVFIGLGFCSSSKSLFVKPVTSALGIKRSLFALNDTCRYAATAIVNLFFGTLILKFGAKKMICAGIVSLMSSMLCFSYGTNVFMFCLGGMFLGIGLAWTTTTMVGSVINKWCKRNSGTIMGAILAANGVGAALATQIFAPIIGKGKFAYRNAYLLTVVILFVVLVLVIIFFRNNPKTVEADEEKNIRKQEKRWDGIEFSEAVKRPYFYIVCGCVFLTGLVLQGITGVVAAYLDDIGMGVHAASVISVSSLTLSFSKFFAGFSYDRFGLRISSGICLAVSVAAMVLLLVIQNSTVGVGLAFAYAVCAAFALPLETIMLPIYAKDLFGNKSYDKFLGIFVSVNTVGYAVGGFVINLCYDKFGSYRYAFGICAMVMAVIFVLMQYVISVSHKERKNI